jgi:EmrB/QacA subfamily drug resistance transporter
MTDATTQLPSQPMPKNRWLTLYVLCAGMLMIILDGTIVNVALPSIQDDLGFSQANLAWVVNAYLIPFGGLLLLAGRLGDLISRRTIFLTGITVFVAASLLCGVAQSQEMLIGARFLQGLGGAMASAGILGMIVTMFPEPGEQAKAIGVYSFVASAGASIGLLAGGVLTEAISWHWIFFVNVPIGIATALLAARLLGRDRGIGIGHGADVPGALLITGSLMLGVYTIVEAANYGWGSARTLILGAISLALLGGFVLREARARNPLMPLGIFRSRNVSGANMVQILMVAGLFGMFFLGALYLQRVQGYGAVEVGLAFLPVSLGIGAFSFKVSPALITRLGGRPVLIAGLTFVALRHRRRALLPGADDARDVGRLAERGRAGLRARQYDPAGRRRARAGRARDALDLAQRRPSRRRRGHGRGADERLPPGVRRRARVRPHRHRPGSPRAPAGAGPPARGGGPGRSPRRARAGRGRRRLIAIRVVA